MLRNTLQQRRSFAIATSAVSYKRVGDQVSSAPAAVKSVTSAANGVKIATLDGRGPASQVAVVVGAGARHEAKAGVAHLLKASLIRARPGDNVVRAVREFELRGNTLYTAVSRENTLIASSFLRDDLVDVVPGLVSQVFNPSFQPYEFLDAIPGVEAETAASLEDPTTRVLDSLHSVAFRRGLGNSLFATPDALHHLKRADLQAFAASHFTADNIAVVGSGVAHEELEALVNSAFEGFSIPSTSSASQTASSYYGGEVRIAGSSSASHLAIGFKSAAFTNTKSYATALVLRALLDGSHRVKWGATSGATGLLAAAAAPGTNVSAFQTSYTDAGLFGLHIQGNASNVKSVAQKSVEAVKRAASSVSDADLARAKKIAIVDYELGQSRDELVADIARQVLASGNFVTVAELAAEISRVSASEVAQAAQALLSSKASVVSYGDLNKLPYADEL
ncbi:LuxS/MPP-like metallohydrolase [Rhizoclosmatium globosum]|uniref:Cytochrome b-c1 complex subunit 2, mitochondrial n=1 Tax=Rhizoclosmatium globosum TaxID=329046 RepID=A0A1Y2C2H6_9FUNG|nr:LuxS/MPP-like metallohydrolase [Rhizoclosmatium globosum]|eukprot:ORY41230.1 LuxS/MPP-like metallohydrolase [Rhizoclosmatium globosum]